jgi:hypothetical protein
MNQSSLKLFDGLNFIFLLQGMNCLSVEPITFHYVPSNRMMAYDFLIYQMKMNTTAHV